MAYTTIDDPSAYFKIQLYTGNSSTNAQTFADTDTDMQPDMVYIKQRSVAGHETGIFDAVRGTSKDLNGNSNSAEGTQSGLTAFGSDGFTLGSANDFNYNNYTYVAWCWKESATSGFDIVSYTGNGSARTISHSTGGTNPLGLILCKSRATTDNWATYHNALGGDFNMTLDTNEAKLDTNTPWNDTDATASVFSVLSSGRTNANTQTYIAYCWAPVQGFSNFGSFVGNGNADGVFVYTGFKPAFVMIKRTDAATNWYMFDNKRGGYNGGDYWLYANTTNSENAAGGMIDFVSNGFKIKNSEGDINNSGSTMVYMAFAEAPFVNSNGVPCNAR